MASLRLSISSPTILLSDNQGCIALSKNPEYHSRTKHVDIKHHFIRECVDTGSLSVMFVGTKEMAADMMTKPLSRDSHLHCIDLVGMNRAPVRASGSVADDGALPVRSIENHAS